MYAMTPSAFLFARGSAGESANFCVKNPTILLFDSIHGGPGVVSGTVSVAGTPTSPVARRVRLHRKADGLPIREVWSNALGKYTFKNIPVQEYYVTAFDHTGSYNATIRDSITPEVLL